MDIIQKYAKDVVKLYRNTIKIRDVGPDNRKLWGKVRESLNCAAVLIGIPAFLNDSEYMIMKEFLISEYKDFSPDEITMAFHKFSSNKLQITEEQGKHYGKLSANFLGNVLRGYRNFRNVELAQRIKEEDAIQIIPEKTNADKVEIRKEFIQNCFLLQYNEPWNKRIRIDKHNAFNLFMMFFECGAVNIDDETKEKYRVKAVVALKEDAMQNFKTRKEVRALIAKLDLIQETSDVSTELKIKKQACVEYFYDYVAMLKQVGTNIEEWLEKIGIYKIKD